MIETNRPENDNVPPLRSEKGISKNIFFVSIAFVAAIGFIAGTFSTELYAATAPLFGIKASSDTLDVALVQKTYQELKANYDGTLDKNALVDGAARGMVAAAGDHYTMFMDKSEADEFAKDLSGEVTGIGCELGVRSDQPTIVRVLDDSPAQQAGLMAGDIFVTVNDTSVAGVDASSVASKIRGPAGSTVKIVVRRGTETKTVTITRAKLNNPSVRWSESDGIGLLTISRFDSDTAALAQRAAAAFKDHGVRGVILDLRDDGGGYLDAAQAVASLWLDGDVVVTEKTDGKVTDTIKAGHDPTLRGIRTIVLVNGGSASASEIVAGALQDHRAATLIGEKTFGKGTVQKLIQLPGGRELKVTIARWYTPNDKNITKEGIAPDKIITLTSVDANAGRDPQLDAAKAELKNSSCFFGR